MGWFSSLFSTDTSQRTRKGQVFNTTHEAFSLPTSSPVFQSHPDAFNPDTLNAQDPMSARSATYTYPPQGSPTYGYVPPSSAFGSRPASSSLLPTHMDQLHTSYGVNSNYPPLAKTWARIHSWLGREYPELGDTLNYGILPQDLAQIEMQFGFALPAVVRESYLIVDGQEAESSAGCSEGLFFGLTLLPLESVLDEWRFWRKVDGDPNTGANEALRQSMQSLPPNWIRKEYSQRGWIPLIADKAGNYLGVDLSPAESGSAGQVIVFGRDFDTKVVLFNGDGVTGWAKWLASFVDELESGEGFELGAADASEDSEDEVGYGSYFYDGNGRGQGDSGGDTGSGLRYTGDYRGWNVLEAWADKSLRKWHVLGVITDAALEPVQEEYKKPEFTSDLDIVELAMQGPGVEVPIPVLRSSSDVIPSPTVIALNSQHTSSDSRSGLPTISVTKPPAPKPVALPTALDIVPAPSPPESVQFDDDLESGRPRGSEDVGLVTSTRKTKRDLTPIRRETSDASGSALPSSPPPEHVVPSPTPSSSTLPEAMQDLFVDEPLVNLATPTEPNMVHDAVLDEEEEQNLDTTIRLVGGGGVAGIAPLSDEPDEIAEPVLLVTDSDAVLVDTAPSSEADTKLEKTHKRSKSSLALKRLSQLSGKKKSESISNTKGAVTTSSK